MRLKTKFILIPIIIILPVLIGSGTFSYLFTRNSMRAAQNTKETIVVTMADTTIGQYFQSITDATDLLARSNLFHTIGSNITS